MDAPMDLSVFDDATDSVVAFDDDGRYIYANPSALRLYGTPDVVGHALGEFAAEQSDGGLEQHRKSLHGRGAVSGESVLRAPDGRLTPIRYRATATYVHGVYLSIVSEAAPQGTRKNGRESARADLFHSVFEYAPEALLLADDRRHYLHGNRMARSFLGVSKEKLVGKRVDDIAAPGAQAQLEQLWKKFLEGGTMKGIIPIVLPNGLRRNILFRARAGVRPGRHLISIQPARADWQVSGLELEDLGPAQPLTFREREILTLLARGSSAQAIAETATLSAGTVRTHVRNAMKKLGARTRSHAIALAIGLRQIDP
jgi:DNA-binding CsgD family transcriptional regulator